MKASAFASAIAAIGAVTASPTPTEQEPPTKRASFPTVTVSGNGKHVHLPPVVDLAVSQLTGRRSAVNDSDFCPA